MVCQKELQRGLKFVLFLLLINKSIASCWMETTMMIYTSNHSTLDWRQEDHWFEASLGHMARSHLEKKEENNKEVGG